MKLLSKYFVYISIVFLLIYLKKSDLLIFPKVVSYTSLVLSIFCLFVGFVFTSFTWLVILRKFDLPVNIKNSLASIGLSIFGKYIPGKLWIIVGKSGYIAEQEKLPIKKLSLIALNEQVIYLWTGLILGAIGLVAVDGVGTWGGTILISLTFFSVTIFTTFPQKLLVYLYQKLTNRKLAVPSISFSRVITIIPFFFFTWIFWCIGFYFFVSSIVDDVIFPYIGLGFSLATTLGVVAVIAPGGIGVREGVLVGFLTLSGMTMENATTVSVASRLWYLSGEVFIFLLGYFIHNYGEGSTH